MLATLFKNFFSSSAPTLLCKVPAPAGDERSDCANWNWALLFPAAPLGGPVNLCCAATRLVCWQAGLAAGTAQHQVCPALRGSVSALAWAMSRAVCVRGSPRGNGKSLLPPVRGRSLHFLYLVQKQKYFFTSQLLLSNGFIEPKSTKSPLVYLKGHKSAQ